MVKRISSDTDVREDALRALYDELPVMHCKGLCSDSCGSLTMTVLEQRYIRRQTGKTLPLTMAGRLCPALTEQRQCSVYDVRPMICRLWGMVAAMRCEHGCMPDNGWMSDADAYENLAQVADLAGQYGLAEKMRAPFRTPEGAELADRVLRGLRRRADLQFASDLAKPSSVLVISPGRLAAKPTPPAGE